MAVGEARSVNGGAVQRQSCAVSAAKLHQWRYAEYFLRYDTGRRKGQGFCTGKVHSHISETNRGHTIDDLVRINCAPTLFDEADEVHVSVAFSWDLERAEKLASAWRPVAPVLIGGPATGDMGGELLRAMVSPT